MIQRSKGSNFLKNRRTYKQNKVADRNSYNLKQLHKTFCEESNEHCYIGQRASAAQLLLKGRESVESIHQGSEKKGKREQPVNFYINIEKLKNLKISNRQKNNYDGGSSYLKKKYQEGSNRKSMLLKNQSKEKKNVYNSVEYKKPDYRSSQHQTQKQKGKVRYKTQNQDKLDLSKGSLSSKGYLAKRSQLKKTKDIEIKDKTFIEGYLRGKQLGRGGFSKVWEGFHFQTKTFYAIKEIDTTNKYKTHLTQIWFGNYFFHEGQPKKQYQKHAGIRNLLAMYNYSIIDPRAFIVYETCDGSLGSLLYDIYQQDDGNDDQDENNRLYLIKYKKLYSELKKSTHFLKCLIYQICQALDLLQQQKIVHSDIKTENILLQKKDKRFVFKLIDYGSSFMFQSLKQYKLATPEYMCPELLNFILYENSKQHYSDMLNYVKDYKNTSAIDVWGLGCIILQLIHGLPLWLTNPTKIYVSDKYETKKGLFAVSDRSFSKILQRQLYVVQNLDYFLQKNNNSGISIDVKIKNILKGMLNPNPELRFHPNKIITMLKT